MEDESPMERMVRTRIEDLELQSEQVGLSEAEEIELVNLYEVLYNLRNEGHP